MFTNRIASYYSQDKVLIEAACLSTDTKPTTGVANGSKCIEMDTGKKYMFNEEDSEWEELPSSGGGGGTTVEALSVTQNGTYTAPQGKAYSPVAVNVSGGSSDFSIKSLTFVNADSDVAVAPCVPAYNNLTLYEQVAVETYEQVVLGDTLYTTSSNTSDIEPSESMTFNVVTYKDKLLLSGLTVDYDIVSATGCSVNKYYTSDTEDGTEFSLVSFTSDNATITIEYHK